MSTNIFMKGKGKSNSQTKTLIQSQVKIIFSISVVDLGNASYNITGADT